MNARFEIQCQPALVGGLVLLPLRPHWREQHWSLGIVKLLGKMDVGRHSDRQIVQSFCATLFARVDGPYRRFLSREPPDQLRSA